MSDLLPDFASSAGLASSVVVVVVPAPKDAVVVVLVLVDSSLESSGIEANNSIKFTSCCSVFSLT